MSFELCEIWHKLRTRMKYFSWLVPCCLVNNNNNDLSVPLLIKEPLETFLEHMESRLDNESCKEMTLL